MAGPKNLSYIRNRTLRLLDALENDEANELVLDWVDQGELDVYTRLRAWWMVRAAEAETNSDGVIFMPPSYLEMITIFPLAGGDPLTPLSPDQAGPWFKEGGDPAHYLLEGGMMTLLPLQKQSFSARFTYYSSDRDLVGITDQSVLIQKAPFALIYASVRNGAMHFADDALAKRMGDASLAQIETINTTASRAREGSGYTITRG